jgi:hypothetical protein
MYNFHKKEAPLLGLQGSGGGLGFLAGSGGGPPDDGIYLVWRMDDQGSAVAPTFQDFGTVSDVGSGVQCTRYSDIDPSWTRMYCASHVRGHVWTFDNTTSTQRVLQSLCNNYADWYMGNNSTQSVGPTWGSSRYGTKGTTKSMVFQHNNGGGESHDIPTLGYSASVWGSGMFWGNIDATSNHGGIMNIYDPHTGSGGSSTGDKLFVYLEYGAVGNHTNYTNYLTPTGPLGDARNLSWSYNGNSGLGGSPSNVADATDRTSTSGWQSYGFQQNVNDAWIQVDLGSGNQQAFNYTFAIGYPGGDHWSQYNRIEASNNGSNWARVAEWQDHNNDSSVSDYGRGYLIYNTGSHVYSNTINDVGKWIAIKPGPAYRYWRLRGTNFNATNSHQLVFNWALLKKNST